ncbi:hypothetical protein [Nocardia carnea]|uniref:hypothetical protein n=1 Tax=Nocardia carnea TaxID=37328 RepID=UPI0024555013|nr:hypothetical protein [Nocardia carnea]
MSQPGQPGPLPEAGRPMPQQMLTPPGQPYPPQGHWAPMPGQQPYTPGPQWAPPPPPRSNRGGVIALVLVLVLVVLGGGGAGAYFLFAAGSSDDDPVVDTSRDLAEAPMGCGLFTEAEIAPLIPGRFTTEPTAIFGGNKEYENSAQCMYSNQDTAPDSLPTAFLSVTTRLHKANPRESGLDKAVDDLRRKTGSPAGVPGADDDKFREIESSRNRIIAAEMSVRYRNVVITLHYTHYALGENQFTQPLLALSALGLEKL